MESTVRVVEGVNEAIGRERQCPVLDCQIPVDIVFRSCDGHLIGAHKVNLAQFSGGFPSPEDVTPSDEVVDLVETSDTLKLLFQFTHNHKFPTLHNTDPDDLFKLAEAAEKYMVHAAMNACAINIRAVATSRKHSLDSFIYALTYDYPEVVDLAAPGTVGEDLAVMKQRLDGHEGVLLAWLSFREQYLAVINRIFGPATAIVPPHDCGPTKKLQTAFRDGLALPGAPKIV